MGFNKNKKIRTISDIKNNPVLFTENYRIGYNYITKESNSLLPLFPFEKDIINSFHDNKLTFVIKSRQMHISSLIASYVAFKLITEQNYTVMLNNLNKKTEINLKEKINTIIKEFCVDNNEIKISKLTVTKIELSNGSRLLVLNDIRSHNIDLAIFDEADYDKNFKKNYQALFPILSSDKKVIIASTPNYEGGYFQKLYHLIKFNKEQKNTKIIEAHWKINPNYNHNIKRISNKKNDFLNYASPYIEEIKKTIGDEQIFNAEYNLIFKTKKQKDVIVSIRLDKDTASLLYQKTNNISEYIRELIKKSMT